MCQAGTRPQSGRMVLVGRAVTAVASRSTHRRRNLNHVCAAVLVMRSVQKLSRFQNHFDNVLVAVPSRTLPSFPAQKEDVHSGN